MELVIGFILGGLIGLLAYRAGALSRSGGFAATLVGGLIFGLGGFPWAVLLMAFFISSSLLSRAFSRRKINLSDKISKGSRRDAGQVAANGSLAAILAVLYALAPEQDWQWIAFAGAMAAVNADTWGTELGMLSPGLPRLITNGQVVERGTSGGVSLMGYAAAFGGALLIGIGAGGLSAVEGSFVLVLLVVTLAGLLGSSFDSLLGATVQAIYFCPKCEKTTERHPSHTCGTRTTHHRGWRWLNNDMVNFACSFVGSVSAVILWQLFV
ncbi:MAG: DUF92 domain-containing protein [Anaerolineales bacterium]|nr:DUF92 domain-containing protein [Anaerolineales bacterium]